MRKIFLLVGLGLAFMGKAQEVSKTVNVTAGQLSSVLNASELLTVTNLTITGTIDARDFKTLRDKMSKLTVLDLGGVNVAAYTGTEGTLNSSNTKYYENRIPSNALLKGKLVSVIFPSTITSIGNSAFYKCSGLSSLTIPSLVTSIGNSAFESCTSLTSITIPPLVTSIGSYAFRSCSGLTTLAISSSVTSIGSAAFESCTSLLSVVIPSSVTIIETYSFQHCTSLTSVTIPSSVTNIESSAFGECSSLTSVYIPSSVTYISTFAFSKSITLITVDSNNPKYSALDGVLFNKAKTVLLHCPISKTGVYPIPSSVISIGYGAFEYCAGLTEITIPESLNHIGISAFAYCSGLITVNMPALLTCIDMNAFHECTSLTSVFIPSKVDTIGYAAFTGYNGLITVDANNHSFSSSDGVLFNKAQSILIKCTVSKTGIFVIPATVTSIESFAFEKCYGLTSVIIPISVTIIKNNAFMYCTGLTSITIPESVTTIESNAFSYSPGITSVIIPASVTTIGSFAFWDCSGLASIYSFTPAPVDLSSSSGVFYNVNKATSTLYVPVGSVDAYKAANQWKDFLNIVELATTIDAQAIQKINLFPNPTTDGFYITGMDRVAEMLITDLNGKLLLKKQGFGNSYVELKSFPPGIYFMKIISAKGSMVKKVIKH